MIKPMAMESCITMMEISMRDNGKTIKPMAKELILMLMEQDITASGKMINSMAMELRSGLMVLIMRGSIAMARKTVRVS